MTVTQTRQPAGVPAGGQFAAAARPEVGASLAGPPLAVQHPGTHWIVIDRDFHPSEALGPYPTAVAAEHAMEHALLVEGECQEDCLDCWTAPVDEVDPDLEIVLIDPDDEDHTGRPAGAPDDAVPGEDGRWHWVGDGCGTHEQSPAGELVCGRDFMAGTICSDRAGHEGGCSAVCLTCGGDWMNGTCTCPSR